MIAQVKRYAKDLYKNPRKHLNWDINPDEVLYTGIIIANKHDIYKELGSDNVTGNFHKIPFLKDSQYYDDAFRPDEKRPTHTVNIRIEMYSYEDIHELAENRNKVFIKLLNNEFSITPEDEIEEASKQHE